MTRCIFKPSFLEVFQNPSSSAVRGELAQSRREAEGLGLVYKMAKKRSAAGEMAFCCRAWSVGASLPSPTAIALLSPALQPKSANPNFTLLPPLCANFLSVPFQVLVAETCEWHYIALLQTLRGGLCACLDSFAAGKGGPKHAGNATWARSPALTHVSLGGFSWLVLP